VAKQATVNALMMSFAVSDFPVVEQLSFDVVYEPAAPIERLGNDWYCRTVGLPSQSAMSAAKVSEPR